MIGNIYLLEKTLEREITEQHARQQRPAELRELQAAAAEAPLSGSRTRVILRVGRLVLTWAAL